MDVLQLNQLKTIFSRFDMDSDGSLTQLELAALLRSIGIKPTGDQIHSLLAAIDANGNGSIEFNELAGAIIPTLPSSSKSTAEPSPPPATVMMMNLEQLMEAFSRFDRDGNGFITAAELAGSMAKMGHPITYRELVEMIQEADTDGDGVISFNEFVSIMGRSAGDLLPAVS